MKFFPINSYVRHFKKSKQSCYIYLNENKKCNKVYMTNKLYNNIKENSLCASYKNDLVILKI